MRRREFVAVALAAAAAGCSAGGGDGTGTGTDTTDGGAPGATDGPDTGASAPTATVAPAERAAARLAEAGDHLAAAADELDVEPPDSLDGVTEAYEYDAGAVEEALGGAREALDAAAGVVADRQRGTLEAHRAYASALDSTASCYEAVVALAAGHAAGVGAAEGGRRGDAVAAFEEASAAHGRAEGALSAARDRVGAAGGVEDLSIDWLRADLSATTTVVGALGALAAGRLGVHRGRLAIDAGRESFLDEAYETAIDEFGTAIGHLDPARDALDDGRTQVTDLGGSVRQPHCRAAGYLDAAHTLQEGALEMIDGDPGRGFELFRKGRDAVRDTERGC